MNKPDFAPVELLRRHSSYSAAIAIPVAIVALVTFGIATGDWSASPSEDLAPWLAFGAVGLMCVAVTFAAVSYALKVAADAVEVWAQTATETTGDSLQP
jgi:glycerol uptake facilitator-like aquaporin